MEKAALLNQFAARLREAMIAAGHTSQRSTSGVCIHKLASITGYSMQICRKYLRGEAIPEPFKLIEIAEKLKISPGWLLFGDNHCKPAGQEYIFISKSLLHYIFIQAGKLYNLPNFEDEIPGFLLELANDVSQIQASDEQSKKIIDLALSSIKHFNF